MYMSQKWKSIAPVCPISSDPWDVFVIIDTLVWALDFMPVFISVAEFKQKRFKHWESVQTSGFVQQFTVATVHECTVIVYIFLYFIHHSIQNWITCVYMLRWLQTLILLCNPGKGQVNYLEPWNTLVIKMFEKTILYINSRSLDNIIKCYLSQCGEGTIKTIIEHSSESIKCQMMK